MRKWQFEVLTLTLGLWHFGCGASDGGSGNAAGSPNAAGRSAAGGAPAAGSSAAGGAPAAAGAPSNTGGTLSSAGAAGGLSMGGSAPGTGGSQQTGGSGGSGGSGGKGLGGASASGGRGGSAGASTAGGASGRGGAGSGGSAGAAGGGGTGAAVQSSGCTKTATLKNNGYNTLTSGGKSRQYYLRWPPSYDNMHPYRLILGFHGAGGKGTDVAPGFFGVYDLSNGSTIFIAPDASGGTWAATDTTFVDDILKAVEGDLCIDTTRVELEGFSQGAAMAWTLTCSRPNVFRAVVGHSGGGLTNPTTCQPVPYLGSLGLSDISGNSQATQTDKFAKWNGCTIENLPTAPSGGHICTNYKGCPAGYPVRWCSYDGGHTPSPNDAGKSSSWMPSEAWPFLSQF